MLAPLPNPRPILTLLAAVGGVAPGAVAGSVVADLVVEAERRPPEAYAVHAGLLPLEALIGGAAGGLLGLAVGAGLGFWAASLRGPGTFARRRLLAEVLSASALALAGAFAGLFGYLPGLALGVVVGGRLLGRRGRVTRTFLGLLLGAGVALALAMAALLAKDGGPAPPRAQLARARVSRLPLAALRRGVGLRDRTARASPTGPARRMREARAVALDEGISRQTEGAAKESLADSLRRPLPIT